MTPAGWHRSDNDSWRSSARLRAGREAHFLDFVARAYCADNLTDGRLSLGDLDVIARMVGFEHVEQLADRLAQTGVWLSLADETYQIPDWLDEQMSAHDVIELSRLRREAGRRGGQRSADQPRAGGRFAPRGARSEPVVSAQVAPSLPSKSPSQHRAQEHKQVQEITPPTPQGARRSRGSRLPEPFIVRPEMWKWAATELGLTEDEIRAGTREFVDYWRGVPGQRGVKLDWTATWRNSIRMSTNRRRGRGGNTQPVLDVDSGRTIR